MLTEKAKKSCRRMNNRENKYQTVEANKDFNDKFWKK